jgi:ring-1,2-phenylacetyl-CoA epoxidase subunit PaaD
MVTTRASLGEIRRTIASVPDPEIPVVTIEDLGILREVRIEDDTIVVTITPTYSGCPAMTQIAEDIRTAAQPFGPVEVITVYSPPWTTDWISERGKQALAHFGIAPPPPVGATEPVLCPRCQSADTTTVSEFGSTACKALMVCDRCREPFDRFKAL